MLDNRYLAVGGISLYRKLCSIKMNFYQLQFTRNQSLIRFHLRRQLHHTQLYQGFRQKHQLPLRIQHRHRCCQD